MIEKQAWGKTKDGKDVELYTCTNKNGLVLKVATYGATVASANARPTTSSSPEKSTLRNDRVAIVSVRSVISLSISKDGSGPRSRQRASISPVAFVMISANPESN